MDCSTPGFPVHHQLPELTQTHVHWLGDAIQLSHPVVPFSSLLQSFSASRSFQMSQFFASGSQSIRASASVLPMNIQGSFPLGWTGWISLQSKGLSRVLQHHSSKASILRCSVFFMVQLSHLYMTTGKIIALTRQTFDGKVVSLFFNMLSRLVIAFLPRSKCLFISQLQSPSAVILKPLTVFIVSPSICHEVMGPDTMILVFWMLSFKPTFSLSSSTFIKWLFSSLLSAIRVVSFACLKLLILLPAILIPACASSSLAFCLMYSAFKLNKQGENMQAWHTSFPIWNQSVVPSPLLFFLDLHTDFSGGRSGGLVFPFLEEFSTVCCDPHSQWFWHSQ